MKRTVLPSRMDEPAKKWMFKTVRNNMWRMPSWIDFEDLVALGNESYFFVRKRYKKAIEPAHIQCLFQKVFMSRITDLANGRTEAMECPLLDDSDVGMQFASPRRIEEILVELPAIVSDLVWKLIEEGPKSSLLNQEITSKGRESINDQLCRAIGLNPGTYNFREVMENYLSSNSFERRSEYKRVGTKTIQKKLNKLGCSKGQIRKHIFQLRNTSRTRRMILSITQA